MEPSTAPSPPSVLVSTGTDKRFPFDRLIDWVERWAARHPEVDVFVQHGVSRAPALPSAPQLSGDDLDDRIRGADAVVLQAGPGGIMRSLGLGRLPIVVPREPQLGEVVDGHQIEFADWAHERGMVVRVRLEAQLGAALDRVLEDRSCYRCSPRPPATAETVARFAARVDRLWRTGR